jgi:hypothetical protein
MSKLLICDNTYLRDNKSDIIKYNEILKLSSFGAGQRINPLDRTNTIVPPYQFNIQFALPTYHRTTFTYEELCLHRAKQLHTISHDLNKKLLVMYSGGIDSTTVLISLLQTTNTYDHIVVTVNPQSILENPRLYNQYIRNKLQIIHAEELFNVFDSSYIIVGGEFNDQLFGVDFMKRYINMYGIEKLKSTYQPDHIINFFTTFGITQNTAIFWIERLEESIRLHANGCVNTNYDFIWWFNFTHKWQHIYYRSLIYATSELTKQFLDNYYHQFFITDDFQLWSMNNPDQKIGNTWNDYKLAAKKFIYSYTKDDDYYNYKCKRGSLYYLMRQRSTAIAIDDKLNFLHTINSTDYYQPNNSFQ